MHGSQNALGKKLLVEVSLLAIDLPLSWLGFIVVAELLWLRGNITGLICRSSALRYVIRFVFPHAVSQARRQNSTTGGGGARPNFRRRGDQGPQISKFPQNHKGPPYAQIGTSGFGGGGQVSVILGFHTSKGGRRESPAPLSRQGCCRGGGGEATPLNPR